MRINTYEISVLYKNGQVTTQNKIVSESDIQWVVDQIKDVNSDKIEDVFYSVVNTVYSTNL